MVKRVLVKTNLLIGWFQVWNFVSVFLSKKRTCKSFDESSSNQNENNRIRVRWAERVHGLLWWNDCRVEHKWSFHSYRVFKIEISGQHTYTVTFVFKYLKLTRIVPYFKNNINTILLLTIITYLLWLTIMMKSLWSWSYLSWRSGTVLVV